jgi:hypothetical protein
MDDAYAQPAWLTGLTVGAALVGVLLFAILPTCLYLYVEPRGRLRWATSGDTPAGRRAPRMVRATAWLSFALGQLGIPWLLVPLACVGIGYAQTKLGLGRPLGLGSVLTLAAVASMALVESFLALRLFPLGVRLLARDASALAVIGRRARTGVLAGMFVLVGCYLVRWAVSSVPGLIHPWLRVAFLWAALRPVMGYALACLLHSVWLGRCARALAEP